MLAVECASYDALTNSLRIPKNLRTPRMENSEEEDELDANSLCSITSSKARSEERDTKKA